jgi:chemotaxis protein CheY-P-specific phosphatase CheC
MDTDSRISKAVELIAQLSVDRASQVLSKLIKSGAKIVLERAYIADISAATAQVNARDGQGEVIGSMVDMMGDAPFKFLFFADAPSCLVLTDLMLQREVGLTKDFDVYVKSTVQEIGNIMASAVCSVFATDFEIAMKPTPPKVMHDFLGTVFQEFVMGTATEKDEVLVIESRFHIVRYDIKCDIYILPFPGSDKTINSICNTRLKGE